MEGRETVPEHLQTAYDMISGAYPNGVPDSDYRPLLYILAERMAHRTVKRVILMFLDKPAEIVLLDIYGVLSDERPTEGEISRVQSNLKNFGIKEWAKQWEHLADDKDLYR